MSKSIEELLIELNNLERKGATAEELGKWVIKQGEDHISKILRSIKLREPIPLLIPSKFWSNTYKGYEEEGTIYFQEAVYFWGYDDKENDKATIYDKNRFIIMYGARIETDFSKTYDK